MCQWPTTGPAGLIQISKLLLTSYGTAHVGMSERPGVQQTPSEQKPLQMHTSSTTIRAVFAHLKSMGEGVRLCPLMPISSHTSRLLLGGI